MLASGNNISHSINMVKVNKVQRSIFLDNIVSVFHIIKYSAYFPDYVLVLVGGELTPFCLGRSKNVLREGGINIHMGVHYDLKWFKNGQNPKT